MEEHNYWYSDNVMTLSEQQNKIIPNKEFIIQNSAVDGSDSWNNIFIGMDFQILKLSDEEKNFIQVGDHKKLLTFNIMTTTDNRRRGKSKINRKIIEENLNKNGFHNEKLSNIEYFKNFRDYKFVISPEGNGIDTHRHYESLMLGCIPICEFNDKIFKKYSDLPILFTKDYSEITEEYLEKKYIEFKNKYFNFSKLLFSFYDSEKQKELKFKENFWINDFIAKKKLIKKI